MSKHDENQENQRGNAQQDGQGDRKQGQQSITPEQAMANTRELLQRKNEEAAVKQAEQDQPGPEAGRYQDEQARAQAQELHQGEMRMQGVHGSISTRDRHNQGRRDSR